MFFNNSCNSLKYVLKFTSPSSRQSLNLTRVAEQTSRLVQKDHDLARRFKAMLMTMTERCLICYLNPNCDQHSNHPMIECRLQSRGCFICNDQSHDADRCVFKLDLRARTDLCWSCYIPYRFSGASIHPWKTRECPLKKTVFRFCRFLLDDNDIRRELSQYLDSNIGDSWRKHQTLPELLVARYGSMTIVLWILSWVDHKHPSMCSSISPLLISSPASSRGDPIFDMFRNT